MPLGVESVHQVGRHLHVLGERATHVMDLDEGTAKTSVPMKVRREEAASAVLGSFIYVFGGNLGILGDLLASCEVLDVAASPPNWRRLSPMPEARARAGAAVVGSKVLVAGGRTGAPAGGPTRSVVTYSPASGG